MSARVRIVRRCDQLVSLLLGMILLGTAVAFGGAVWWARPVQAIAVSLLVLVTLARFAVSKSWGFLLSPLSPLWGLALALAAFQLVPLPAALAERLSGPSRAVQTLGTLPELVHRDDPDAELPEPGLARTPVTVDRPATLRWLVGSLGCLAVFAVVAHFVDRVSHTLRVWGMVVGSLFFGTFVGAIQLLGGSQGLFGYYEPGRAPIWAPAISDLLTTPNRTILRPVLAADGSQTAWALPRPDAPWAVAGWLGGPGTLLALGSLALPLALGMALNGMAPRGCREPFWTRMRESGRGGLPIVVYVFALLSAALCGFLGGRTLIIPLILGLALAGLPAAWSSGLRWAGVGLTALMLVALIGCAELGARCEALRTPDQRLSAYDLDSARESWSEASGIARDFRFVGAGLGSYATIQPYYKATDAAATTASSSLFQWCAETGLAGMAILALAGLWCLIRLPGALKRVSAVDRLLAFGLAGAMVSFGLFSVLHWSVELGLIALAASAVGGTMDRWLAGGTDLFAEPV